MCEGTLNVIYNYLTKVPSRLGVGDAPVPTTDSVTEVESRQPSLLEDAVGKVTVVSESKLSPPAYKDTRYVVLVSRPRMQTDPGFIMMV